MGELIGGMIVFGALAWIAIKVLEFLAKVASFAIANFVSTVLIVGGVILGFGLLAGEASAAVAVAVPASVTVAKMRLSTMGV